MKGILKKLLEPSVVTIGVLLLTATCVQADYSAEEFVRVTRARDSQIDKIRSKEIQQLQLVLSRNLPSEQKPDMLLRLAELFTEKYRLYFLRETEVWQQKMESYLRLDLAAQKHRPRPALDNGASRKWLGQAVKALERIQQSKLSYSKMDEVYYFLGFNYWEMDRKQDSLRYFAKILQENSKSRYAPEAYRYMGDAAFSRRDFKRARENYFKSAQYNTPAKPRVLYGLGWSHFKMQQYREAAMAMREAIQLGSRQSDDAESKGIALQRDALDALALFYSEGGEAEQAGQYFSSFLNKNLAYDMLRKLASIYQRQGRFAKALNVNKQLTEMGGASAQASDEQRYSIILDSLRVAGNSGDRVREAALIKSLVAEFVLTTKHADPERSEQIRVMLRKAALLAHQEGNKRKDAVAIFARAEDLYRTYLSAFGSKLAAPDLWEIRYLLADSLTQQGKHIQAAKEFQSIVVASEAHPKEAALAKYQKDSVLGMIYSLDAASKDNAGKLSAEEREQLISAIDIFVRMYPKERDVQKYLARAAGVLVTSKQMDAARPRLEFLAREYSSGKEGLEAAVLLVKDAEETQSWDRVVSLSKEFLANAALMAQDKKGELRRQLENVRGRAQFKEVKSLEEDKNYAKAATQYEHLAKQSSDKEIQFKALNNAAVSYGKAGDVDGQRRIYEMLLKNFPQDKKTAENLLALGNLDFLNGNFTEAAETFERYYTLHESQLSQLSEKRQEDILQVLRNALYLREAMGAVVNATENLKRIIAAANRRIAGGREAAEELLARQAERLRLKDNKTEALKVYQRYVQSFPEGRFAIDAYYQSALLFADLREPEKMRSNLQKAVDLHKKSGKKIASKELTAAALARLQQTVSQAEAFFKMPLRLPEAKLKADISAQLKALETLVKEYVDVVNMGDGSGGVEALRRLAAAYQHFGEALENAPAPKEYSAEDKAKFKAQLKQVAGPVFQKRNETLENALKTGQSLYVAGPTMAKIYVHAAVAIAQIDRFPMAYELSWSPATDWLAGDQIRSEQEAKSKRELLQKDSENAAAWNALGNYYALKNHWELARVLFLRALSVNKNFAPALANLAYLEGREGGWQPALTGYRAALEADEFSVAAKKDLARIYMASGLWRHANLTYRQLEVRTVNDPEVKQGLAYSYLAMGKTADAEPLLNEYSKDSGTNTRFAKAILQLGKGNAAEARTQLDNLHSSSELAALAVKNWRQ